MTTYTTWQTESGGHVTASYASTIPATSGYAFFVGRGIQYQLDGFVASGFLYIPKATISALPPGKYQMLPQVIDSSNRIYFLTPLDIEVERILSVSETSFTNSSTILSRLAALEAASGYTGEDSRYARLAYANTFSGSQTIEVAEDIVPLTLKSSGSFPTSPVLDAFDREDASSLGSNWTLSVGELHIVDQGVIATTSDPGRVTWNATDLGPDIDAFFEVKDVDTDASRWIDFDFRVRLAGTGGYIVRYEEIGADNVGSGDPYTIQIYRRGPLTLLTQAVLDTPLTVGDAFGVRIQGSGISGWIRQSGTWSNVVSTTDSTYSDGDFGFELYSVINDFNDPGSFAVEALYAGPTLSQTENLLEIYDADNILVHARGAEGQQITAEVLAPITDLVPLIIQGFNGGTFPQVTLLDNFNRADGAPGSNWTADPEGDGLSAPVIASNRASFAPTSAKSAWWNVEQFGADVDISVDIASLPTLSTGQSRTIAFYVRLQTPNSLSGGYVVNIQDDFDIGSRIRVFDVPNYAIALAVSPAPTYPIMAIGDTLGVRLSDNVFTIYRIRTGITTTLGTLIDTGDITAAAGYVGLYGRSNAGTALAIDNFSAATLTPQTENLTEWYEGGGTLPFRVSAEGYPIIALHSAPSSSVLAAGECAIWFDQTNGAAKLKIKAKQANGTVVSGEVALT